MFTSRFRFLLPAFLAVAFAALTGCSTLPSAKTKPGTIDESRYTAPIRLACVGDSITFGSGIKDRQTQSYPAQLGALLGPKWDVRNFGLGGTTLLSKGNRPYIQQKQYRQALDFKPDVVVIKLGTNDTKPINWDKFGGEYTADYEALIASFAALETKPVIYLCRPMPCWLPGDKSIREKVIVEEVIPKVEAIAKAHGFVLIDLYTPFKNRADLVPDKIHPNAEGAGIIARTVYTALTGRVAE